MKNKHYIKTVEDIKYCEENGLTIYSTHTAYNFEFEEGKWNAYDEDDKLRYYDYGLDFIEDLYYYEEESEEPMQEATVNDIHKLCWFWGSNNKNMELGILESVNCDNDEIEYESSDGFCYKHCRELSPAEVSEITGYKVEEK